MTAVLRVPDVAAAIASYRDVLGAEPRLVLTGRDGTLEHAELALGERVIWIDRSAEHPRALGGTSGYLQAPFARLPMLAGWDHVGLLWRDPLGHLWRPAAELRPVLATTERDFYERAFSGVRIDPRDGADVGLASPAAPWLAAPRTLGGAPFRVHLYVASCAAAVDHAVRAGAKVIAAPAAMPWGDRWGLVEDPAGHTWGLGERIETLTQAEIQARLDAGDH